MKVLIDFEKRDTPKINTGDIFVSKYNEYYILHKHLGLYKLINLKGSNVFNVCPSFEGMQELLIERISAGVLTHYSKERYSLKLIEND